MGHEAAVSEQASKQASEQAGRQASQLAIKPARERKLYRKQASMATEGREREREPYPCSASPAGRGCEVAAVVAGVLIVLVFLQTHAVLLQV